MRAERIWHPTGAEEITGDILLSVRAVRGATGATATECAFGFARRSRKTAAIPAALIMRLIWRAGRFTSPAFSTAIKKWNCWRANRARSRDLVERLRRDIRRFIERNFSQDQRRAAQGAGGRRHGRHHQGNARGFYRRGGQSRVVDLRLACRHARFGGLRPDSLRRFVQHLFAAALQPAQSRHFWLFLAVVFYTALAGAMVPTVRSAIMIGVYELAVLLDREEEVFTSLTLAALLIALVWPGVIADISFQLSFLAVLFIVWGMRRIHEWFAGQETRRVAAGKKLACGERLRQAGMHLAVPLLATLGTGPLIAHYFGHLSLAGFVANPVDRAAGRFCRRAARSGHRLSRRGRARAGVLGSSALRRNCCR